MRLGSYLILPSHFTISRSKILRNLFASRTRKIEEPNVHTTIQPVGTSAEMLATGHTVAESVSVDQRTAQDNMQTNVVNQTDSVRPSHPIDHKPHDASIAHLTTTSKKHLSEIIIKGDFMKELLTTYKCVACLDDFYDHEVVRLTCGCRYDDECLERLIQAGCESSLTFPPRCHGTSIDFDSVRHRLQSATVTAYKGREAERYHSDLTLYCANEVCSLSLKLRPLITIGKTLYKNCEKCGKGTCERCRMLIERHTINGSGDLECPPDPRELVVLRNLGAAEGWKQCPYCGELIEKDGGCSHVECNCGGAFCWDCITPYDDENEYCRCDEDENDEETTDEVQVQGGLFD